jgi:plasmid maintenance system antidote protein VapI
MIRIPTQRPPTHPGEMLLQEFLIPMGISQRELADSIHVPSPPPKAVPIDQIEAAVRQAEVPGWQGKVLIRLGTELR